MTSKAPGLPRGFSELPARVYQGDPSWIPEDPVATERAFSSDNPWFATGEARAWCIPGSARVAAFHHSTCRLEGAPAVFFGLWETSGDRRDNARLFAEVERWGASRRAKAIYGPIDFNTYGTYRLLTEGEPGSLPFPGEPYNPPDYPALIESLGFSPHHRYLTQIVEDGRWEELRRRFRPIHRAVTSRGYRFGRLDAAIWMQSLPEIHRLVDQAFADSFAYTPLDAEAFRRVAGMALVGPACPETSVLAQSPAGDVAGFLLAVPHYGPLVVAGAGSRRIAAASLSYERHLPLLRRRGRPAVLVKTVAVAPSHRRRGLLPALVVEALERAGDRWSQWWPALMREDNRSRGPAEDIAARRRGYTLYRKPL